MDNITTSVFSEALEFGLSNERACGFSVWYEENSIIVSGNWNQLEYLCFIEAVQANFCSIQLFGTSEL